VRRGEQPLSWRDVSTASDGSPEHVKCPCFSVVARRVPSPGFYKDICVPECQCARASKVIHAGDEGAIAVFIGPDGEVADTSTCHLDRFQSRCDVAQESVDSPADLEFVHA
jgi:hypothetical protein